MTLSADLDYVKTLCPKPLPNTCQYYSAIYTVVRKFGFAGSCSETCDSVCYKPKVQHHFLSRKLAHVSTCDPASLEHLMLYGCTVGV